MTSDFQPFGTATSNFQSLCTVTSNFQPLVTINILLTRTCKSNLQAAADNNQWLGQKKSDNQQKTDF